MRLSARSSCAKSSARIIILQLSLSSRLRRKPPKIQRLWCLPKRWILWCPAIIMLHQWWLTGNSIKMSRRGARKCSITSRRSWEGTRKASRPSLTGSTWSVRRSPISVLGSKVVSWRMTRPLSYSVWPTRSFSQAKNCSNSSMIKLAFNSSLIQFFRLRMVSEPTWRISKFCSRSQASWKGSVAVTCRHQHRLHCRMGWMICPSEC